MDEKKLKEFLELIIAELDYHLDLEQLSKDNLYKTLEEAYKNVI